MGCSPPMCEGGDLKRVAPPSGVCHASAGSAKLIVILVGFWHHVLGLVFACKCQICFGSERQHGRDCAGQELTGTAKLQPCFLECFEKYRSGPSVLERQEQMVARKALLVLDR